MTEGAGIGLNSFVASAFFGRFAELRPTQRVALPAVMAGKNIVLSAGTGSGKTEAAVAPLVSRFYKELVRRPEVGLLYVVPTKALANDIEKRLIAPLGALGLKVGIRHGDRDDTRLAGTRHLLVTTPESLDVMLSRNDGTLSDVRGVILDEVHLLYNTQRGLQLAILLRRLNARLSGPFQWVALSATVGDLDGVRRFLFGNDEPAELLELSVSREIEAHVQHTETLGQLAGIVRRMMRANRAKLLLFADSRRECERLAGALSEADIGGDVLAHYSSLSPEMRLETEAAFAMGRRVVCVATSTLELGIDIGDIDAVVLWGAPHGVDSFLQRIGRGNRRGDVTNVVCLVPDLCENPGLELAKFTALLGLAREGLLPRERPFELFGALGQQCCSMIAANDGKFERVADLAELLQQRPYVDRRVVERVLEGLERIEVLQRHGFKNRYGADEGLWRLVDLRMVFGNMPSSSTMIDVLHGGRVLGQVPAVNLFRLHLGVYVRFAGKKWRVAGIGPSGLKLEAGTAGGGQLVEIKYGGLRADTDAFVLQALSRQLASGQLDLGDVHGPARRLVEQLVEGYARCAGVPQIDSAEGVHYLTFAGSKVNAAIGEYLELDGYKASDLWLRSPCRVEWSGLSPEPRDYLGLIDALLVDSRRQSFFQSALPVELQRQEMTEWWLKNPSVRESLGRLCEASSVPAEERLLDLFKESDGRP